MPYHITNDKSTRNFIFTILFKMGNKFKKLDTKSRICYFRLMVKQIGTLNKSVGLNIRTSNLDDYE